MLSTDLVITTSTTGFWFPEPIAIGGVPGWNGILNLVRSVGWCKAATVLFQPDYHFSGPEAVQAGFVNILVDPDGFENRLDLLVGGLLKASSDALVSLKKIFWGAADSFHESGNGITELTIDCQSGLFEDKDGEAQNRMGVFTCRIKTEKK